MENAEEKVDNSSMLPVKAPNGDASAVKTDGAVAGIVLVGLAAAGAAWWVLATLGRPAPKSPAAIPVSVLDEPGRLHGAQTLRKQAPSGDDASTQFGQAATFLDIARPTNAKSFMGKLIRIKAVPINTMPGKGVLTVGPGDEDSILVKLPAGSSDRTLALGQSVFIVGRLMPEPTQQTEQRWGITPDDEAHIGHRAFYIQATVLRAAIDG